MKYNDYILISSWQDIHYGIYLIHIKKFKKISLIFFEKDLYNFFHKKLNLGKQIKLFFIRIPYINLQFRPKNILSMLKYPYQIYLLKKKLNLFFFNESTIYTFGNNIAFKNGIFLKYSNFNKIYSYDITKIKEELLKKRNIKNTFFLNKLSIKRLKFIYHFLFYNAFSGYKYQFWHDGNDYKYFKIKKFKNEEYLDAKIFDNNNFSFIINNFIKKKIRKNAIVFLLDPSLMKNLNLYFYIIKKKINFKTYKIYFKFHPNTSTLDESVFKKAISKFAKNNNIKNLYYINKKQPLELINFIPTYFVGYVSSAFKFLIPSKNNIILIPNKLNYNLYHHINVFWKFGKKIRLVKEKNISKIRLN
jgi:hypothetical protein